MLVIIIMIMRVVRVIGLVLLQQDVTLRIYVQSAGFCP